MSNYITLFIAITIVAVAVLADGHRRRSRRISSRIPLSDEDIYQTYFANLDLPKKGVLRVWHEIALRLKVDPKQLRPDDVFGRDVGASLIVTPELDELEDSVRHWLQSADSLRDIKTVGQCVEACARNAADK